MRGHLLLYHVNVAREKAGLTPLRHSRSLTLSAWIFVKRLHNRPLAHDSKIHADGAWWWLGEVLARGQQTSAEAVRDWLASPGHRAILLSKKAKAIGSARDGETWVAQLGSLRRRR